jgi:hypothetical protein
VNATQFLQSLGDKFPTKESRWERERLILEAVINGYMLPVRWKPITSVVGGRTVRIWVSEDVLRIGEPDDYVRVTTTAKTVQLIADYLDARILTPKIIDLIWMQADVRIEPLTNPSSVTNKTMLDTVNMVKHSRDVDAAIKNRIGLVADIGKHWCLSNALTTHPGMAAICGWHTEHARPDPNHPENGPYRAPCGGYMWQTLGISHNTDHFDYSMFDRLVCRVAEVDGARVPYDDVADSAELAPAISYEGRITCKRYPDVKYVPPDGPLEDPPT